MKGDFSRITFDRGKHFARVLMQQGRVQLDADWNEQASILLYYLQALAVDLIGPHGGSGNGFLISPLVEDDGTSLKPNLAIEKGHYYVDGILCENEALIAYTLQEGYPFPDSPQLGNGTYLVYLDVWERHVTHIEDGSIREVALGMSGPDTATRAAVVWQVKIASQAPEQTTPWSTLPVGESARRQWVDDNWPKWLAQWQPTNRGQLKVKVEHDSDINTDPCITPPEARYRGTENQLYRVEIHKGGQIGYQPTFKWSRDNGSVVAAWVGKEGNDLLVSGIRDAGHGFAAGHWVELTDGTRELRGEAGTLVRLIKVEGEALTIDPLTATGPVDWNATMKNPKVRRWDQTETEDTPLTNGSVPIKEGTTEKDLIDLEDGIQIQFQPGATYRPGDYWLIPARTATGDVEWPGPIDQPEARRPRGVDHHYAPLAIISVTGSNVTMEANLRRTIEPLGKPVP